MTTKIDAIQSLCPNAHFITGGTSDSDLAIAEWHSAEMTQPTEAEIDAEVIRLQAEYDSQEYARKRKSEYNQLNQFEMQFDDDRDSTSTWVDTINEIKGRHPKP